MVKSAVTASSQSSNTASAPEKYDSVNRFQFSLTSALGFVLVVALCCAALRSGSDLWVSACVTLTVGGLFTSLVGIVYHRGCRQAFWVGFAIFGWGSWILDHTSWMGGLRDQLPMSRLTRYLTPKLQRPVQPPAATAASGQPPMMSRGAPGQSAGGRGGSMGMSGLGGGPGMAMPTPGTVGPNEVQVWYVLGSFLVLLFATIGGCLARLFHRSREATER
jgi:hypothetical protein